MGDDRHGCSVASVLYHDRAGGGNRRMSGRLERKSLAWRELKASEDGAAAPATGCIHAVPRRDRIPPLTRPSGVPASAGTGMCGQYVPTPVGTLKGEGATWIHPVVR